MAFSFLKISAEEAIKLNRDPLSVSEILARLEYEEDLFMETEYCYAINLLLTGREKGGDPPLCYVFSGERWIDDCYKNEKKIENPNYEVNPEEGARLKATVQLGEGGAYVAYTKPETIRRICDVLISSEALKARYDPDFLGKSEFLGVWNHENVDELVSAYEALEVFYTECAEEGRGVLIFAD